MPDHLQQPKKHHSLPSTVERLGGVGEGARFHIQQHQGSLYRIRRWSADGQLHCDRLFTQETPGDFSVDEPYSFTYVSHCARCKIEQDGTVFEFVATGDYSEEV